MFHPSIMTWLATGIIAVAALTIVVIAPTMAFSLVITAVARLRQMSRPSDQAKQGHNRTDPTDKAYPQPWRDQGEIVDTYTQNGLHYHPMP